MYSPEVNVFNTMLKLLITGTFSLGVFIAFIAVIVYYFKFNNNFNLHDNKISKYLTFLYSGLFGFLFIFLFVNKKIPYIYESLKTVLPPEIMDVIQYEIWVGIYIFFFIISAVFAVIFFYIYSSSGMNVSRSISLVSFPFISKSNDTGEDSGKNWVLTIIESAGVLIFMFAFTYFLFNLTDVHFEQNIKELGDKLLKQGIAFGVIDAYTFVFLILAGVREEIVFRLFIQRSLTKLINKKFWGPFISITLVSIVWAFGHYGTLVPGWVKILQIFIFGILLGILSRRHGIGSCILVHVMFNISTGIFNNLFIEI